MLKQRIVTAIVALIALLLALFVVPPVGTRIIIAALMLVAAWEWAGFLGLTNSWMRLLYVVLLGTLGGCLWFSLDPAYVSMAMKIALLWWSVAFAWLFFYPTAIPTAFAWLAGALVIIPAWLALDRLYLGGTETLLVMLGIVWAADIGAYFAGKRFGRVKLAPQISPGKTWEGVIGGMLAVSALAITVALTAGLDLLVVLPLCLAVAVISIVGDLTVSIFKRNAGLKDSGKLFPGHGGVLDRIDGVTAAAPVFVFCLSLAGLS
jgi:phosphatidate cytidylyltransferase